MRKWLKTDQLLSEVAGVSYDGPDLKSQCTASWMFWVPLQRPVGLNSLGGARINQPVDREFASLHANLRYLYANRPFRLVVRLCSNFIFHLMD